MSTLSFEAYFLQVLLCVLPFSADEYATGHGSKQGAFTGSDGADVIDRPMERGHGLSPIRKRIRRELQLQRRTGGTDEIYRSCDDDDRVCNNEENKKQCVLPARRYSVQSYR
ncbi:hypothetical protein EDD16DRAFT_1639808 [Pisolithus croceorrhizus]|nr:hypothetical protein EDD16DRAFT_1639808 [Pisolithus croceorrhizus]